MLKSELAVDQFVLCPHAYPASSSAVSHDLVQSSPLLRVTVVLLLFAAKGRNVCMTNVRSSTGPKDCNIGRIATPLPKHGITSSRMNAHTRAQSVSATCGCQELSQCVQALSSFVYQTLPLSQCVSLIKTGLYA